MEIWESVLSVKKADIEILKNARVYVQLLFNVFMERDEHCDLWDRK